MSDPPARPAICLNMIVKNEAHIVGQVLDSVAPLISSWVIVDTGSDDGTQDLIRLQLSRLGIPGQLYERPWRNFGHNRTEALTLAQGCGDYIWVIDADDLLVGTPDFTGLSADIYHLRYTNAGGAFWRAQMFRDGARLRYEGAVHEYIVADGVCRQERLEGDYHVEFRELGSRSTSGDKFARDRDVLLREVEHNPEDPRSVFYLAESYFSLGDFANARAWYARRSEMGGWAEETYFAMYRLADSMAKLGEAWPDIQDAYLRAWAFRPVRAEPLYEIAREYRKNQRYALGYLFAQRAAGIPLPGQDSFYLKADVYGWHAIDEQAVCASWIGKQAEAFTLWRSLLARPDLPDDDRRRIAANRDVCVPTMLDAAAVYPETVVASLAAGSGDPDVIVTVAAGPDVARTEHTLNTFLNCCTDVARVGRFLAVDTGLTAGDRDTLSQAYPFLEFTTPASDARYRLHLDPGWRFFAPEALITRLIAVLHAEPQVYQVAINLGDATALTGHSAPENTVRRAPETGRYVLSDVPTATPATGPSMIDTTRPRHVPGACTATLDEVLGITESTTSRARSFAVLVAEHPDYEHSDALREVAEGLHHSLLALGHDSVLTNRCDLDERHTIVLGASILIHYGLELPKKPIFYNLEQVGPNWLHDAPDLLALFRRHRVWDYSHINIARLAALDVPRPMHVPIGYVPELTRIAPAPEDIDVLFYGVMNDRRRAVLDELQDRGLRVVGLCGVYGTTRDAWIARSKIVINIHHYDTRVFEIARVSYALANQRAVVSERGADAVEEHDLESGIAFAEYDGLVDRCVELVKDDGARRELAERGFRIFSARSQADILRSVLAAGLD